jgi:hypothetical protein
MDISVLLWLVGGALLFLAIGSGLVLFYKAACNPPEKATGMDTLWGLLVFGLIAGFILVFTAHGCHR